MESDKKYRIVKVETPTELGWDNRLTDARNFLDISSVGEMLVTKEKDENKI